MANPMQQAAIVRGAVGAGDVAANRQAMPSSGNVNRIMYSSTSYDDNFAENKNTLASNQFGFLPSILKSFY